MARPRREGPRPVITTLELLRAVADHGPQWVAVFDDVEITSVTEALDRELLAGNLLDATRLSEQGRRLLAGAADGTASPVDA
ncbi:MAG TPA: hypothetical protein VF288_02065 [Mycobacteriales bacterium]